MFGLPCSLCAVLLFALVIAASRGDARVVPPKARTRPQQARMVCEAAGAVYLQYPEAPSGTCRLFLTHQGLPRFADVYFPPDYSASSQLPLWLQLHGLYRVTWNQSASANSGLDHLKRAAEHAALTWGVVDGWLGQKAVHVYPDATQLPSTPDVTPGPQLWNSGYWQCPYSRTPTLCISETVDDLGFLEELTQQLISRLPATPTQVYAMGFSNGGMIITKMLCESAYFQKTLTAAALVSTVLGQQYMTDMCGKGLNNTTSNRPNVTIDSVTGANPDRSHQTIPEADKQFAVRQNRSAHTLTNTTDHFHEGRVTYLRGLRELHSSVRGPHTRNALTGIKVLPAATAAVVESTTSDVTGQNNMSVPGQSNTADAGSTPNISTLGVTDDIPTYQPDNPVSPQTDRVMGNDAGNTAQPVQVGPVGDGSSPLLQRTVPLIFIHGLDDTLFPLGQDTKSVAGDELHSTLGMVGAWANQYKCPSSSSGSSESRPPLVFSGGKGVSCRNYCFTDQQQQQSYVSPSAAEAAEAAVDEDRPRSQESSVLQIVDSTKQQLQQQQPAVWLCLMDGVGHQWKSFVGDLSWMFFTNRSSFTHPLAEPDNVSWRPLQQLTPAAAASLNTAATAQQVSALQLPLSATKQTSPLSPAATAAASGPTPAVAPLTSAVAPAVQVPPKQASLSAPTQTQAPSSSSSSAAAAAAAPAADSLPAAAAALARPSVGSVAAMAPQAAVTAGTSRPAVGHGMAGGSPAKPQAAVAPAPVAVAAGAVPASLVASAAAGQPRAAPAKAVQGVPAAAAAVPSPAVARPQQPAAVVGQQSSDAAKVMTSRTAAASQQQPMAPVEPPSPPPPPPAAAAVPATPQGLDLLSLLGLGHR